MSVIGHRLRAYKRPVAVAWTPTSLPSLVAWYDADTAGDFTLTGSTVNQWNDKSGNARHQSSDTGTITRTANVQNGRASVSSAGSSSLKYTAGSSWKSGATLLLGIVGTLSNGSEAYGRMVSAGDHITDDGTSSGYLFLRHGGQNVLSSGSGNNTAIPGYDTWFMSTGYISAGTADTYVNGTAGTSGSYTPSHAWRTLRLFNHTDSAGNTSTGGVTGNIGELAIASAYTSTDREKLEGYLAHRWGLEGSLPGGHPYKTTPP